MKWFLVILALIAIIPATLAIEPSEVLDDPVLEARARAISSELRCLVCQNQSVDESDSSFAKDIRLLVRERLVMGEGDRQIIDFMVARYGEFILLRPFFAPHTYVLWFFTPFILIVGVVAVFFRWKRRKSQLPDTDDVETALTRAEQKTLDSLSDDDGKNSK